MKKFMEGAKINENYELSGETTDYKPPTFVISPDRYARCERWAKANNCTLEEAFSRTLGLKEPDDSEPLYMCNQIFKLIY